MASVADAVTDYTINGHLSTTEMIPNVLAVWENNKANAVSVRNDRAWLGDSDTAKSMAWNATSPAAKAGWKDKFKYLDLLDITRDSSYVLKELTAAHTMVRDFKNAFNLPGQSNDDNWMNEYTDTDDDKARSLKEYHYFNYISKDVASSPMCVPIHTEYHKCVLVIGLSGFAVDEPGDEDPGPERNMTATVRPDDADKTVIDAHYTALKNASTQAADYTDPALVGEEYTVTGNILLINCENMFKIHIETKDMISLNMGWNTHTYAEIKALMDAARAAGG